MAALCLAVAHTPSAAQNWPTRPITIVVPGAAGGPIDVIARVIAPRLGESLGASVIVENVTGAGGMTAGARVASSPADGYRVLLGAAGVLAQNQTLYKHPLYDSTRDFSAVGLIAKAPAILVARKNLPANNIAEFISYLKNNQTTAQFGSSGAGSGTHIACLLLNSAIGVTITHIPYRGIGPAYQDLIAGRFDYMCDFISTALPQIEGGSVKGIATLTRGRTPVLPNLPTAHEQGLTDFDTPGWYAFVLPAGTPDAIVRRLNGATSEVLDDPEIGGALKQLGNTVAPAQERSPAYLATFIRSEIAKWAGPIKASGMSLD